MDRRTPPYEGDERRNGENDRRHGRRDGNVILEWAGVILKVGPLSAMCLYGAYVFGRDFPQMRVDLSLLLAKEAETQQLIRDHTAEMKEHTRVLYLTCVKLAGKDPDAIDRCLTEQESRRRRP